jgi:hypothetical protein
MDNSLSGRKRVRQRTKLHIVRQWLTSFSMTVGVVFFVVAVVPSNPEATFVDVVGLKDAVVYEVSVTDSDHALDDGTLTVELSNQFGTQEQTIGLGFTSGVFGNLDPDTEYRLTVIGNKGFGDIALARTVIMTEPVQGPLIVMRSDLTVRGDYDYTYVFDVYLDLPDGNYEGYSVSYGMIWMHQGEESPNVSYTEIPINAPVQRIVWEGVYGYGYQAHIKLEHTYVDGETQMTDVLDEILFYAPFEVSASFYVESATGHAISGILYPMFTRIPDAVYTIDLLVSDQVLRSFEITKDTIEDDAYMVPFVFDGLDPEMTYTVRLSVFYVNPDTLRETREVLDVLEFLPGRGGVSTD